MKMTNTETVIQSDDQLLRINDVVKLTTLSKSCINLWVTKGRFPKPLSLSKTIKVWRIKEVRQWAEKMHAAENV